MEAISLNLTLGGVPVGIRDLRREPNLYAALGMFLRELADAVDPPPKGANPHGQNQNQAQP